MKKGILRISFGAVLLFLQLIGLWAMGEDPYFELDLSSFYNFALSFWAYFGTGICGIVLLIFGLQAYKKGERPAFVLHVCTRKIHTVIRWVCVGLVLLIFLYSILRFVCFWQYNSVSIMLLQILSAAFLLVYLLFYIGKRPSYVFSAALILVGIMYLFRGVNLFANYILYFSTWESAAVLSWSRVYSFYMIGILYIVLAVKFYREKYTGRWIRIFGWAAFIFLLYTFVFSLWMLWGDLYFDEEVCILLLLSLVFFIYTGVLKVQGKSKPPVKEESCTVLDSPASAYSPMPVSEEFIVLKPHIQVNMAEQDEEMPMLFCRKCGSKLMRDGKFCHRCGTGVIFPDSDK